MNPWTRSISIYPVTHPRCQSIWRRYWRDLAEQAFDQQLIADTGEHGSMELVLNSTYKLAVENYCESCHLPFVHPELNTYPPLDAHFNLTIDPLASDQGTRVYDLTRGNSEPLPQFSE